MSVYITTDDVGRVIGIWDEDTLPGEVDPTTGRKAPIPGTAIKLSKANGAKILAGGSWIWTGSALEPSDEAGSNPTGLGPISDRQFFQALASAPYNIITPQEALDAVKTGEIPAVMQAVIDGLPEDQQFPATMLIAGATTYQRTNPMVAIFAASQNMDEAATNAFWQFAEGL